jgi:UDP-N-acetylmuramyl pentapeptide synthase
MTYLHLATRRFGRLLLKFLTQAVLRKHHPTVIAVAGEGPTSLLREALYTVFHEEYPTRRNLESPEAEFSLPLTIIGARTYPPRWWEWPLLVLKTTLQLIFFRSYHHYLILEMSTTNKESFLYWLEITHPQVVVISGHLPDELEKNLIASKIIRTGKTTLESLESYRAFVLDVAQACGIDRQRASHHFFAATWPPSRFNLRRSREGKIILDATYHYLPLPWTTVREVAEGLPGAKIVILDPSLVSHEASQIKYPISQTLDSEKIKDAAVIILRGPKFRFQKLIEGLVA